MIITFENDRAKVNDNKLVVEFAHVFQPFADHPEIKVHCEYFHNTESYSYRTDDGMDVEAIFLAKVSKIEGIEIKDVNGNTVEITPQMIVDMPILTMNEDPKMIIQRLYAMTVSHIVSGDSFNKEEEKK